MTGEVKILKMLLDNRLPSAPFVLNQETFLTYISNFGLRWSMLPFGHDFCEAQADSIDHHSVWYDDSIDDTDDEGDDSPEDMLTAEIFN